MNEAVIESSVDIRPRSSIYSVLKALNYKPWFALAEYVDNAIQSSFDYADEILSVSPDFTLRVSIEIDRTDGGRIVISDNAAGIHRSDFSRAFRAAELPPDRTGLSEFGMGMKSASCWFGGQWEVKTTSAGDINEYTVLFDVDKVTRDNLDTLAIRRVAVSPSAHYTQVTISDLHRIPVGRTLSKIRDHLTDIYRVLIRRGALELRFNGILLSYEEPPILSAPFFRTPDGDPVIWRKPVSIDLVSGPHVEGFAALRETGDTARSGFALFRRGRAIEGSADEGYRPPALFGAGNTYRSQRLFGELHVDGVPVSHTKDGFQWGEYEDELLEALRAALDSAPVPLLRQAEGFRKNEHSRRTVRMIEQAVQSTAETVRRNMSAATLQPDNAADAGMDGELAPGDVIAHREVTFAHLGRTWIVHISAHDAAADGRWFTRHVDDSQAGKVLLTLELNMAHPFLVRFGQKDADSAEVILRIAVAIAVAEILGRAAGNFRASETVRSIGEVLTRALSGP